ncbi:hypothetical protein K7X08_002945 [Anisodus acutangulus]|uniref:Uncharacterized protein n=1 Tax=Anisodus acutangulus TaxID=402998 RepID=A0A9Q1MD96_9SOLA|nr:hypothetical protein K7X08_002945 [Anisodus acutangulus]
MRFSRVLGVSVLLGFTVPNIVDNLETETTTTEDVEVTKGKQTKIGRKTKKRTRSLIDEGVARSPPTVGFTIEEELKVTTPQPTQTSQASTSAIPLPSQSSNSASQYRFMPTPSVPRQQPINNAFNVESVFEFPSNNESKPVIILMLRLDS